MAAGTLEYTLRTKPCASHIQLQFLRAWVSYLLFKLIQTILLLISNYAEYGYLNEFRLTTGCKAGLE
jgi:hypothetical protein